MASSRMTTARAGVVWLVASFVIGALSLLMTRVAIAIAVPRYGDYPLEADPPIRRILSGDLFSVLAAPANAEEGIRPFMMPLSLILRAPFVLAGQAVGIDGFGARAGESDHTAAFERYVLGAAGAVAVAAVVASIAAFVVLGAAPRLRRWLVSALVGLFVIWNPLTLNAVQWGHPEEVLMMAFIASGLALVAGGRHLLGAAAIACAVATKQPALLIVPVAFFMVPATARLRALGVGVATLAVTVLPWTLLSLDAILGTNARVGQATASQERAISFWHLSGDTLSAVSSRGHVLAAVLALAIGLLAAWRYRWTIPARAGLWLAAAVMALRVTLDPFNIEYYALAPLGAVLAIELSAAVRGWRWAPGATLLTAASLVYLSDGPIASALRSVSVDVDVILYTLIVITIVGLGLVAGFGGRDESVSDLLGRRAGLYTLAGAVVVIAVSTMLGTITPNALTRPDPPTGFVEVASPAALRDEGITPYWVGDERESGAYAIVASVPKHEEIARIHPATSVISYAFPDSSALSISTIKPESPIGPRARSRVADCVAGACPDGYELVDSSLGPAVLQDSGPEWTAYVPLNGKDTLLVGGFAEQPAVKMLSLLAPVPAG